MATINSHKASPSNSQWSCEVFLSFSSSDTHKSSFACHLYMALERAGLHMFRDDVSLLSGEVIASKLLKAIEGLRVSVIVLSKNYASSLWCLKELVMSLKCRSSGHVVLPVFYVVDPCEVRWQTGSFKKVFVRHEERFKKEMVQEWRAALKEVADLAGFNLPNRERGNAIFSIIGYINGSNRAQSGRQDWRDLSASCPEEERTREQRNKEEISSHVFSSDTLQQHFGSKCEDVPKSLGSKFGLAISFPFSVCASTLKCICRYRGIPWRPNRITKSGVSIGNMTIEGGVSIVGNSNISAPVLIGNTFVYQLLVTQIPEGERQSGIQLSELVGSYVNMNTGGGVSIGNTNIEVGCI